MTKKINKIKKFKSTSHKQRRTGGGRRRNVGRGAVVCGVLCRMHECMQTTLSAYTSIDVKGRRWQHRTYGPAVGRLPCTAPASRTLPVCCYGCCWCCCCCWWWWCMHVWSHNVHIWVREAVLCHEHVASTINHALEELKTLCLRRLEDRPSDDSQQRKQLHEIGGVRRKISTCQRPGANVATQQHTRGRKRWDGGHQWNGWNGQRTGN